MPSSVLYTLVVSGESGSLPSLISMSKDRLGFYLVTQPAEEASIRSQGIYKVYDYTGIQNRFIDSHLGLVIVIAGIGESKIYSSVELTIGVPLWLIIELPGYGPLDISAGTLYLIFIYQRYHTGKVK